MITKIKIFNLQVRLKIMFRHVPPQYCCELPEHSVAHSLSLRFPYAPYELPQKHWVLFFFVQRFSKDFWSQISKNSHRSEIITRIVSPCIYSYSANNIKRNSRSNCWWWTSERRRLDRDCSCRCSSRNSRRWVSSHPHTHCPSSTMRTTSHCSCHPTRLGRLEPLSLAQHPTTNRTFFLLFSYKIFIFIFLR